jgi:DNA-nicking Smr family endonuclease
MGRKHPPLPDHHLWEDVARRVKPLSGTRSIAAATKTGPAPAAPARAASSSPPPALPLRRAPAAPPPLTGLDRRTEQRLTRGKADIESRIDLHGYGVELARVVLMDFLRTQQLAGSRLVLVITGKGASPFSRHTLHGRDHFHVPEREGRLRREVPLWLHEAEFRRHVTGFQPAHPRHGGGGAFYVRLRRLRGDRE